MALTTYSSHFLDTCSGSVKESSSLLLPSSGPPKTSDEDGVGDTVGQCLSIFP